LIALALRLARRDLRGGVKAFRLAIACLALGVTTIAGVGSFAAAVVDGLKDNGQVILGADVALRTTMIVPDDEQMAWLAARGTVSRSYEMNAMAQAGASPPVLVSLKAVDGAYPLYGAVALEGGGSFEAAIGETNGVWGAIADEEFLVRLGIEPGERFRLGEGAYELRGIIADEPDRASAPFQLGPRLIVAIASLDATGLVQPGSMIRYDTKIRLADGGDAAAFVDELDQAFPLAAWRVRSYDNANPQLKHFLTRLSLFISLVGLTALLIGGIGVASAVNAYLATKVETIATMKSLGAPADLVFLVYLTEIIAMAAIGTLIGLAAGAVLPGVVGWAVSGALPVPVEPGLHARPLIVAAAYGGLTALAFAIWPLARARLVPAAALFREQVARLNQRPGTFYIVLTAGLALMLALLTIRVTHDRLLAAGFVVGALVTLALFRLASDGLTRMVKRLGRPRRPGLRLALANLTRPGAATGQVVVALGIGLTVLIAVVSVQGNLTQELGDNLPADAPSFFFVDIQPDQAAAFDAIAIATPGVHDVDRVPSLRGRIVAIDGVPVNEATIAPEARWAVDGDRGVTYAATVPDNAEVVAGDWWPADYSGPPLLSFESDIAEGFGIGVGDTLTVNVMGRDITATIANLRDVDWSTLGINFTLVYAPGLLESAPHTFIATVHADRDAEAGLRAAIAAALPNVSAIGVRDVLNDVIRILRKIDAAVGGIGALALVAGLLVLAESVAAAQRRRVYDAVILKVLGATRSQLFRAYLLEHLILGLATAVLATAAGTLIGWIVTTVVLKTSWSFQPVLVVGTAILAVLVTLVFGYWATWRALRHKAAPVLRSE